MAARPLDTSVLRTERPGHPIWMPGALGPVPDDADAQHRNGRRQHRSDGSGMRP